MITDTSVPTQISSRLETELSAGRLTRAQGPCWFIDEHGDPSLIDETFSPPFPLKNSDKPESKEALPPALPSIENGGEAGASSSSSKEGGNQEQAGKEVLGKGSGMKRTAEEAGMDWGKNEKDGDELWQCPHPSCSGAFESPVGLKRHFMERSCEVNGRDVLLRMVERIEEERGEKEAGRLRRNRI